MAQLVLMLDGTIFSRCLMVQVLTVEMVLTKVHHDFFSWQPYCLMCFHGPYHCGTHQMESSPHFAHPITHHPFFSLELDLQTLCGKAIRLSNVLTNGI